MNPDSRTAEDQAALWAAKLDGGSLTSSERADLESWLARNSLHRTLLTQYCQLSTDLEEQLPLLVSAGTLPAPVELPIRHSTLPRKLWLAVLGGVAAAAVLALWPRHPAEQNETVATSVAQRRTLQLVDGSTMELSARTSVLVSVRDQERRVRIAEGEAFFTVARDTTRPFIVETPAGSVRVTGTVFDVNVEQSATLAVTVVSGSVQVQPGPTAAASAPIALTAGEHLTASGGAVQRQRLSPSELDDALAWRRGEAVFTGTPLATALGRFARHHGRTLTADPDVAGLKVAGRFGLDDLEGFLNAIEAFLPVQVSRDSSGAIALKSRTGS